MRHGAARAAKLASDLTPTMAQLVLVIGSAPANVEWLGHRLQTAGFEVITTHDLLEGRRKALDDDVALVVLDLTGDNRSLDALSVIHQARLTLPVIALSDRVDMPHRLTAFEAGASDVLVKPFSFDELGARLNAQIRRSTWT